MDSEETNMQMPNLGRAQHYIQALDVDRSSHKSLNPNLTRSGVSDRMLILILLVFLFVCYFY